MKKTMVAVVPAAVSEARRSAPVASEDEAAFDEAADIVIRQLNRMSALPLHKMHQRVLQFAVDVAEPLKRATTTEAREHEVMAALELNPAHYVDTSMPMATAGFTSLAWQALMAKWQVQAVLVLMGGFLGAYTLFLASQEPTTLTANRIKAAASLAAK